MTFCAEAIREFARCGGNFLLVALTSGSSRTSRPRPLYSRSTLPPPPSGWSTSLLGRFSIPVGSEAPKGARWIGSYDNLIGRNRGSSPALKQLSPLVLLDFGSFRAARLCSARPPSVRSKATTGSRCAEKDQNRYSAGRGAHINLKRAEKARVLVSKIPSLVETLTGKVKAWESDKGACFLYDKKSLLETLDEYAIKRQQRDDERRRSREHKRLQEQYTTEQEVLFGTKPSPLRHLSAKKPLGQSNLNLPGGTPVGRRFSTHLSRPVILSNSKDKKDGNKVATTIPLNFVALSKDC